MLNRFLRKLTDRQSCRGGSNWKWPSETSKCRRRLAPFCTGYGVAITPHAIRVDFPIPYADVGSFPVQLGGDAKQLSWFRDDCLDFVYSSHLLEDYEDTEAALREWLRVLKPGGHLVTFCPDEQIFRKHCSTTGQPYNPAHKHANFSLALVKGILANIGQTKNIYENPLVDVYSWELVSVKL